MQLILLLILLKTSYSLSDRECQGMANSLFLPHGISVPCYTTICRRRRHLLKYLSKLSRRRPKICIMDSSGFKISGEGEWFNERNDALAIINSLGNNQSARSLWGRLTGYCHRVKGESAFSRLKRLFSESLYSRNTGAQLVELWLKALLSNIWLSWAS